MVIKITDNDIISPMFTGVSVINKSVIKSFTALSFSSMLLGLLYMVVNS